MRICLYRISLLNTTFGCQHSLLVLLVLSILEQNKLVKHDHVILFNLFGTVRQVLAFSAVETMQKRIQIVTNANTQIINEIVLMIFINTTSPRQSSAKHRNQVKKVNGKETLYYISEKVGQLCKQSTWPWLVSFPLTFFTWFLCLALLCLGDVVFINIIRTKAAIP
jgi:hypothetical protein